MFVVMAVETLHSAFFIYLYSSKVELTGGLLLGQPSCPLRGATGPSVRVFGRLYYSTAASAKCSWGELKEGGVHSK